MSNIKMPHRITLSKEECYCGIEDLYFLLAKKLGYNPEAVRYDCREICVTKAVMDQVFAFYMEDRKMSKEAIAQGWIAYGPKANVFEDGYVAIIHKGFILEGTP